MLANNMNNMNDVYDVIMIYEKMQHVPALPE